MPLTDINFNIANSINDDKENENENFFNSNNNSSKADKQELQS